jgi:RNA polymerase sigma-70 factor (TIGR02957 family)
MRERATITLEDLEPYRPLLFSIAYRMVGEVGDAEDVVQDAFLRAHRTIEDGTEIREPKAFLTEVTTRLAIDHLRSARVRRERYVGSWLPEPLLTDEEPDPAERVETIESLSMAFLVVLESLSPVERAVFLLHDVFRFGFDEIARVVGKSVVHTRQIAVRARKHVEARRPRFETSAERRSELAKTFFDAVFGGDLDALVDLLAEDVVMTGDGGGRGGARLTPARGRVQVARFLLGLARYGARHEVVAVPATVNGAPGLITYEPDGSVGSVMELHVVDGRVAAIHSIVNPDKLRHLPPMGTPPTTDG